MPNSEAMRWLVFGILIAAVNMPAPILPKVPAETRQVVVVSAPSWKSETGKLEMLSNVSGVWRRHGHEVPVVFGHGLAGGQDGAMFPAPDEVKKLNDFLWTEDDGQFLGTFGAGMMSAKDQSFLRVTL